MPFQLWWPVLSSRAAAQEPLESGWHLYTRATQKSAQFPFHLVRLLNAWQTGLFVLPKDFAEAFANPFGYCTGAILVHPGSCSRKTF